MAEICLQVADEQHRRARRGYDGRIVRVEGQLDVVTGLGQRPYHAEYTGSRLITAVKQGWAWLVLGWVTAWEHHVLLVFFYMCS